MAWIIGWDLILELALGAAVVAKGWSAVSAATLFDQFGGLAVDHLRARRLTVDWGADPHRRDPHRPCRGRAPSFPRGPTVVITVDQGRCRAAGDRRRILLLQNGQPTHPFIPPCAAAPPERDGTAAAAVAGAPRASRRSNFGVFGILAVGVGGVLRLHRIRRRRHRRRRDPESAARHAARHLRRRWPSCTVLYVAGDARGHGDGALQPNSARCARRHARRRAGHPGQRVHRARGGLGGQGDRDRRPGRSDHRGHGAAARPEPGDLRDEPGRAAAPRPGDGEPADPAPRCRITVGVGIVVAVVAGFVRRGDARGDGQCRDAVRLRARLASA